MCKIGAKFGGHGGKCNIVLTPKMSNEGEKDICSKMPIHYDQSKTKTN